MTASIRDDGTAADAGVFENLYRGDRPGPFEQARSQDAGLISWDIGEPQPIITELERAGEIVGPVLEAGCGFGDNAVFLARLGYQVTAFDIAPTVIRRNQEKTRDSEARFLVADATTLDGVEGRYRTVIDSALLHCLDADGRQRYLAALRRICEPGARLHILCFSDAMPIRIPGPHLFRETELRHAITGGWVIRDLHRRLYTSAHTCDTIPRMLAAAGAASVGADAFATDDQGRILLPIWQLAAEYVPSAGPA